MKSYVAGLMFSGPGRHVALIRKNRPPWQAGYFNAIGGKIESGEAPHQAIRREFREETGVDHLEEFWQPLVRLYKPNEWEVYFFSARTDSVFYVSSMTDEQITVFPVSEIPYFYSLANLRWLIPIAVDRTISRDQFINIKDEY